MRKHCAVFGDSDSFGRTEAAKLAMISIERKMPLDSLKRFAEAQRTSGRDVLTYGRFAARFDP